MNLFESIILGIVQGLTEFLPISSSAHLALLEQAFGVQDKLQLAILLHFGSVIAIIVAMRREIKRILTRQLRFVGLLIVGTIPAGVAGLLLKSKVESVFESTSVIGICLIMTGFVLWLTRFRKVSPASGCDGNVNSSSEAMCGHITVVNALLIGLAQALAILPGVSRSGITIAAGIFLGVDRGEAARFSFLLAVISILGATAVEVMGATSHVHLNPQVLTFSVVGIVFSFVASYFAIKCIFKVVRTRNFSLFAIYCWVLGFVVLVRAFN
jgi:undecaprenyl-diphosphatase